jgi:hypothetical protein
MSRADRAKSKPRLAALLMALGLGAAPLAAQEPEDPSSDAPSAEEPAWPAPAEERDTQPNAVRTMRPKIWDEPAEANGVLTTEHAVIPASLSLARARRLERAQVDPEALADRAERMLAGERFTQRLPPLSSGDAARERASDLEISQARAGDSSRGGSGIFSIAAWTAALGALGALVWIHFRSR